MPGSATAEIVFIVVMMVLILVVSFAAVFFFFKTYRKEMAEKEARKAEAGSRKAIEPAGGKEGESGDAP